MSKLKIESAPVPKDIRSLLFHNGTEMEIGQPEAYILEADGDALNMNGTEGNWRIFRDNEYIGGGINKEIAFAKAQKLHDEWLDTKS